MKLSFAHLQAAVFFALHQTWAVEVETETPTCEIGGPEDCYTCNGEGMVREGYYHYGYDEWQRTGDHIDCPDCDGTGKVDGEGGSLEFDWDVKSEHCGAEMVTGVMVWEKLNRYRKAMSSDINSYVESSSMTGGHVHVDLPAILEGKNGSQVMASLGAMIVQLNDNIHDFLNIDKYRADGTYCKVYNNRDISTIIGDMVITYEEHFRYEIYSKYRWLNVSHMGNNYCNTIEFRVFDTPESIRDLENNVSIAQAICLLAREFPSHEILATSPEDVFAEVERVASYIRHRGLPNVYDQPRFVYDEVMAELEAASSTEE